MSYRSITIHELISDVMGHSFMQCDGVSKFTMYIVPDIDRRNIVKCVENDITSWYSVALPNENHFILVLNSTTHSTNEFRIFDKTKTGECYVVCWGWWMTLLPRYLTMWSSSARRKIFRRFILHPGMLWNFLADKDLPFNFSGWETSANNDKKKKKYETRIMKANIKNYDSMLDARYSMCLCEKGSVRMGELSVYVFVCWTLPFYTNNFMINFNAFQYLIGMCQESCFPHGAHEATALRWFFD